MKSVQPIMYIFSVLGAFPSSDDAEELRGVVGHALVIACRRSSSSVPKALFYWQIADGVNDEHPVKVVLDGRKSIDENGNHYALQKQTPMTS